MAKYSSSLQVEPKLQGLEEDSLPLPYTGEQGLKLSTLHSYLSKWCELMWKITAAMRIALQNEDD